MQKYSAQVNIQAAECAKWSLVKQYSGSKKKFNLKTWKLLNETIRKKYLFLKVKNLYYFSVCFFFYSNMGWCIKCLFIVPSELIAEVKVCKNVWLKYHYAHIKKYLMLNCGTVFYLTWARALKKNRVGTRRGKLNKKTTTPQHENSIMYTCAL